MATFFGFPTVLYHPVNRTNHFSSLQTLRHSLAAFTPLSLLHCATPTSRIIVGTLEQPEAVSAEGQLQRSSWFDASDGSKVGTIEGIDSTVTRRLGLGADLALAGFLAAGCELSQQEANSRTFSASLSLYKNIDKDEEVVLPNGIRYYDLRVGDGDSSRQGDLVLIDVKGNVESNGEVFVDTFGSDKKSLTMVMGSRPYSKGICEGIECALRSMKAGGIRRVILPHSLGYEEKGVDFGYGLRIPPLRLSNTLSKKLLSSHLEPTRIIKYSYSFCFEASVIASK